MVRRPRRGRSWQWFFAWMIPGICLGFGVTSLGIFLVPVGLITGVALRSRSRTVDSIGGLAGLGAVVLWIGAINLDYQACGSHAPRFILPPGAPTSTSFSCGGVNGLPWMILGASAAAVAIALYLLMTRSASSGDRGIEPVGGSRGAQL
jgi:hypothetical protein